MNELNDRDSRDRDRQHIYIVIDLKSFYASVECVERGLDPMTTDLVVADPERTDKTITLAVSPSLKAKGVRNRCRVFEIPKHLDYIMAPPRMQLYVDYSAEIYGVYLDYIAPEDMFVYSIDEIFIDITAYLRTYRKTPREMAQLLMGEVLRRVGVRATCGIGTNLYLAKIALDITAKHSPDFIGYLDENAYINTLWDHRPLTDFWRIGPGTARRLARIGIDTMGGIARADEDLMYRIFGVDAELLIDHAWGREPVTMADIKAYRPKTNSLSSGQVLMRDYEYDEARIIVKEMADNMCLDMTAKGLVCRNLTLAVGYSNKYDLPLTRGTVPLIVPTNAAGSIVPAVVKCYNRIVNPAIPVRRIFINCNNVTPADGQRQMTLFDVPEEKKSSAIRNTEATGRNRDLAIAQSSTDEEKDVAIQEAVNKIKKKYGKNAMLKGVDFEEAATMRQRNEQIGGHRK